MVDGRPDHRLFAALYDPVTAVLERTLFARHRAALADGLTGRVLDLGCGTGAMFPYYAAADGTAPGADGHEELSVVAVEPDPHVRRRAQRRAAALDLALAFVDGDARSLPFADDAFDAVLSAIVLCTVPDRAATLDEVARVLATGGEFRVFEHVHGDGWYGRMQTAASPAWGAVAGGCHLDRDTDDRLRDHPAFAMVAFERFSPVLPPVSPFVRGRLRLVDR